MHLNSILPEIRQALRRLTRERGFSTTVLLTLALCIGANVAIFAVVDAIIVRPLPFPESDRLVTTINSYPGAGAERSGASLPNYYDRRNDIAAFESVSVWQPGSAIVGAAGSPNRISRDRVSPEFFATLKVPLVMGRTFTEDELLYANAQVMIITHEFWQNHFDGASDILGRELTVDGLKLGLIIAMCAIGLSLIYGTTGLTNFAHGEMVTFGAMIAFVWHVTWQVSWFGSWMSSLVVAGVVSVA